MNSNHSLDTVDVVASGMIGNICQINSRTHVTCREAGGPAEVTELRGNLNAFLLHASPLSTDYLAASYKCGRFF